MPIESASNSPRLPTGAHGDNSSLLPAFVTTKRELIQIGLPENALDLELSKMDVQAFRLLF